VEVGSKEGMRGPRLKKDAPRAASMESSKVLVEGSNTLDATPMTPSQQLRVLQKHKEWTKRKGHIY
jgi:hypothetical protein